MSVRSTASAPRRGSILCLCLALFAGSCGGGAGVPPDEGLPLSDGAVPADGTPSPDGRDQGTADLPVGPDARIDVGPGPDVQTADGPGGPGPDGGGPTLPAPVACAAPTLMPGATFDAAQGEHFTSPRLAWGGAEAGLAYAESSGGGTAWSVLLQRLGPDGQASGAAVTVGMSTVSFPGPHIAVATDGMRYVVCWESTATQLLCGVVPVGQGDATSGLSLNAGRPAVAYGRAGFLLVAQGQNTVLGVFLDDTAEAAGPPANISQQTGTEPQVVATPSGYAVATATAGGPLEILRLPPTLQVGSPITAASSVRGPTLGLAGSGEALAVVYGEDSQVSAQVITGSTASAKAKVDKAGAQGIYSYVGAAGGDPHNPSFAVTWSAFEGTIGYRALDGSGTPQGSPVDVTQVGWDDNPHAIAALADAFLIATTVDSSYSTLALFVASCP
jgi:hypothetical protein